MNKTLRERELWLLIFLALAYCWRVLLMGETFFFRDLYSHFLPSRQFLADTLRAVEFPLWNPYLHAGQPFLANINNVALYPTGILYVFLPLLTAFNLEITLHLIACAAATYVLARRLGMSQWASFVAGGIYAFCGYTLSCATFLNRILAAAWLPILLLAWHSYLMSGTRRWLLASSACGAMLVLAGAPETTLIGFATILIWTLVYPSPQKLSRNLLSWLLMMLLVAGLTAVQTLPTQEMIQASVRSLDVFYEGATKWSLNPRRLPESVLQGLLGRTDALAEASYWGRNIVDGFPYIPSIYFGMAALLAALAAGLSRSLEGPLPVQTRRGLLLFAMAACVFSLGRHLPGYSLLYEWVPFLKSFRYPIKFLNAALLPAALLAGHAFHRFVDSENPLRVTRYWAPIPFLFGVVLFGIVVSDSFASLVQETLFLQQARADVHAGIVRSLVHAFGFSTILLFALAAGKRLPAPWRSFLVAAILVLDLFAAGRWINPTARRSFFTALPEVAVPVKKTLRGGRLFRLQESAVAVSIKASTDEKVWRYQWELNTLSGSSGVFYRIPVIYDPDYDGLTSLEMTALGEYAHKLSWDQKNAFIDAGSATVILAHEKLDRIGMQLVAEIHNTSNLPLYLYQNFNAVPRVRFSALPVFVGSAQDALAALVDPRFRPKEHVILMNGARADFRRDCTRAEITVGASTTTSSIVTVAGKCAGWVVFSDPYNAGWRVTVDGNAASLLKANYAFSAVRVEPGTHVIRREYAPKAVVTGALISAMSLLAMMIACLLKPRSRLW